MTAISFAILSITIGLALLALELVIPSHGVLGVMAALALLAGAGGMFVVDPTYGAATLLVMMLSVPFVWVTFVKLWPHTPVGKRVLLPRPQVTPPPEPSPVAIGQQGVSITELRPIGECEFEGRRMETVSDLGMIPPGRMVKVVALDNNRPVVRVV